MRNGSTRGGNAQPVKPEKPYEGFPLFAHPGSGQWAKKIRGKRVYFGSWRTDPEGKKALEEFNRQWPFLKDGRTPPPAHISEDGCTVREACNDFLEEKDGKRHAGDLALSTFQSYHRTCQLLVEQFPDRRVDDLRPEDFRDFRRTLAKTNGAARLAVIITHTRMVFRHAFENELVEKPMRFGSQFEKPSKRRRQAQQNQRAAKVFRAEEIRRLMEAADVHLQAMILLGANAGFGNMDAASLPKSAINWETGWLTFPRGKTQIARKIPLWDETLQALRASLSERPEPAETQYDDLCFLTVDGVPWVQYFEGDGDKPGGMKNTVTAEFLKLLKKLGINGRKGLGFYALRHTFETVGGESCDQVAVDAIMGHKTPGMGTNYRHGISDARLKAVVDVVHDWLFPPTAGCIVSHIPDFIRPESPGPAEPYSTAWLAALAEAINPIDAPKACTIRDKFPAADRTESYLDDLPRIRAIFPGIPWPESYQEALTLVREWHRQKNSENK